MFILKNYSGYVLIGGKGQLEIHLLAGAVVHVKGELRILHQFFGGLHILGGDVVQHLLAGIGVTVDNAHCRGQERAGLPASLGNANGLYAGHHEPATHHVDPQHLAGCVLTGDCTSQRKHHRFGTSQSGGGFLVQKFSEDRLAHASFHPFSSILF